MSNLVDSSALRNFFLMMLLFLVFADAKIFDEDKSLPPPRAAGNIQLKFTPRAFVTPSRESKAPEEEAVCIFC